VLAEWGITAPGLLGDALLVVTELVSNAVVASRGLPEPAEVRVWLCCDRVRLLVAVGDRSLAPPVYVAPSDEALSGRGLQVVDTLSSGWAWFPATTPELAKIVWAELYVGPPAAAANGPARSRENAASAAGPAGPGQLARGV
jgi:hypothetical protein